MNSVSNSQGKGKSIAAPDTTESVGRRRKQFLTHTYIYVYASEGMRKNKERFFILKYKPVLNDLKLR